MLSAFDKGSIEVKFMLAHDGIFLRGVSGIHSANLSGSAMRIRETRSRADKSPRRDFVKDKKPDASEGEEQLCIESTIPSHKWCQSNIENQLILYQLKTKLLTNNHMGYKMIRFQF